MRPTPVSADAREGDARLALPVWGRIGAQLLLFSALSAAVVAADLLLASQMDTAVQRGVSLLLAALPALLWLLFSALPESRVDRPRRLLGVAVVSGLCAATFGLPLAEDFFALAEWLPLESALRRIVAYTVTAGTVDVGLKFLVLRYMVVSQSLRARSDAIAFAMAAAVGYSFAVNVSVLWRLDPVWDWAAIYVLTTVVAQFASSMAIALGIIASLFRDAAPVALPASLLVGAVAIGLVAPQAPGLLSGSLGTAGSATRPLFALGFLLVAQLLSFALAVFFFTSAERRQRESTRERQENARMPASLFTQRQRFSMLLSWLLIALGMLAGINQRDSALNRVSEYSNVEAGITARYPARWLLEESGDYVFRARDMSRRGFETQIAVYAVAAGGDSSARSLFDLLSLERAQSLIDYAVLGYDAYALADGSSALTMAHSYVARDANPLLQGVSTIVRGLDMLLARRGQAIRVLFLADSEVYDQELATLDRFIASLDF